MSNQDEKKIKIAVLGSCVTRDNFNSLFNPNYSQYYTCVSLQNQTSLISLMSSPINYQECKIDHLNEWDTSNVITELDKRFLSELIVTCPDFLIIDLFADVFFGCIEINEKIHVTNNHWKIKKTSFFKEMVDPKMISIISNEEQYLNLWEKSTKNFFTFLQKNMPNCKVILHKASFVNKYIHEDKIEKIEMNIDIKLLNEKWRQLDHFIESQFNVEKIDLNDKTYLANFDHPWGLFTVHYEKEYYQNFLSELDKLVGLQ